MLWITLADLRFRARQFLIAMLGAALVFAMTLLLAGLSAGFRDEINQTVQGFGATAWVVHSGSAGRVTSFTPLPATIVPGVKQAKGVTQANPAVIVPVPAVKGTNSASIHSSDVVLVGQTPSGEMHQTLLSGHWPSAPGQAVVDTDFSVAIGQHITVSGRVFRVVGLIGDRTLLGGSPLVFVTLSDAQGIAFGEHSSISAILVMGTPTHLPHGLVAYSNSRVELSSLDQMSGAVSSVDSARSFMWIIATIIVAALVYVSALERTKDFAILRALGASKSALFLSLAGEAVAVSVMAAAAALVIANYMTGIFALRVDIPISSYATLPLSACLVGLVAALVTLRRAVGVDPSTAFAEP